MSKKFTFLLTGILVVLVSHSTVAQESIIKEFAEERRDLKVCFYPSTLRMINISNDPNYNELVSGIEKLLIYRLDSITTTTGAYTGWIDEYRSIGYEEYISMTGAMNLTLLGTEEEFVGVSGVEGNVIAFYLRGVIALNKIPELIRTFESGDMLSIINDQLNR